MQKGAITFLDVVGWVGIYRRHKDAINGLLALSDELRLEAEKISRRLSMENLLMGRTRGKSINTYVKSISDTIVILTADEPEFSLKIHGELSKIAINISLQRGMPLRGATSFGEYDYKENIMIGPAVDEAAAWHEYIEWFGCILTPSAFFLNCHSKMDCWVKYDAPSKSGKISTACADWVSSYDEGRDHLCKKFVELGPIVPKIESKYSNTLAYFDYCIKMKDQTAGSLLK